MATLLRMPRLRLAHAPLVVAAIGRWLVGTKGGRKVLAVGASVTALVVLASGHGGSDAAKRHEGTWSGLYNEYAPNKGEFAVDGATCTFRGRAGYTSGSGWVFKGSLSVAEVACGARVARDGRVTARLKFKEQWDGQVKGIGGDWDDRHGHALCEGDVDGKVASGGTWKGTCTNDDGRTYASSFSWTLRAE